VLHFAPICQRTTETMGLKTHGNRVRRASVMPCPARSMGVSPTLGLTTEPVKVAIGDRYGAIRGQCQYAGSGILTPWKGVSSRSRLASYPSMMLRSWMPCSAVAQGQTRAQTDAKRLYFTELFRRSRHLPQVCQTSIHERMREDV
jgi:hypothetical protein